MIKIILSANTLSNFPLNYLRSGYYYWHGATLNDRTTGGYWWSTGSNSTVDAYYLVTATSVVNPQGNYDRGPGFARRRQYLSSFGKK